MSYFLSDVIKEWEKAAISFQKIIENVSIVRIGLVLSKNGGVLKQTMLTDDFWIWCLFWKW